MGDTPRTDAKLLVLYGEFTRCFVKRNYENMQVPSEWACQLERELSESARKLEEAELEQERMAGEWREEVECLQQQLAEAKAHIEEAGRHSLEQYKQLAEARKALQLSREAMRHPIDGWKGEVERKALDAIAALEASK